MHVFYILKNYFCKIEKWEGTKKYLKEQIFFSISQPPLSFCLLIIYKLIFMFLEKNYQIFF